MGNLFQGFDLSPFLNRPTVPYQAPRAPDVSGQLSALDSFMQALQFHEQKKRNDEQSAARQRQLDLEQSGQAETKRYHDLEQSNYQTRETRLSDENRNKHIAEIQKALPDAQSAGDHAKVQALLQELGRLTGWQMGEYQTNYQAPPEAPPQAAGPQGSPGQAPPLGFDDAYDAMVKKESGGNPRAINPKSGALGTFQLMQDQLPPGVTKDQFLAMSPEQQKQVYLNNYLPAHGLDASTLQPKDVGLSVGAPAAITMPDEAVVYPKGSKAVAQNPSWDRDKDGKITAAELRANYGGGAGGAPPALARPPEEAPPSGPAPFLQDYMAQQPQPQDQGPSGAMPWDLLGLGSPPPPKPEAEVQGGGRYVFRDAAGKVQYEYDRTKVQADQQGAVKSGLQPLLDNASTDAEKKAARGAIGFASSAVGNGLTPKEAYFKGLDYYEKALSEQGKSARAGVSSEWGQLKQLQIDSDKVHQQTATQFGLAKLNESATDVRNGLAALDAHNGFGDMVALGRLMKDLEGGRVSDADYQRYSNSTGWLNNFMNMGNRLLNGEQNPQLVAEIRQVLVNQQKFLDEKRHAAADVAGQAILQGSQYPLVTPEMRVQYADRAMQRILGGVSGDAGAPSPRGSGGVGGRLNQMGQQAGDAVNHYGTKSLDDLERELGGGQ